MNCTRAGFIRWRRANSPRSSHHCDERREKWAISAGFMEEVLAGLDCAEMARENAGARAAAAARGKARATTAREADDAQRARIAPGTSRV